MTMDLRFMPQMGFAHSRWTPLPMPLASPALGQAAPAPQTPTTPTPAPAAPAAAPAKPAFIDGAFLAFLFDGAAAVAGAIAGNVYWKTAKEKTSPKEKATEKRKAYFFYGLAGVAAVKGVLDGGRIMR
jgi:hypothetical protein